MRRARQLARKVEYALYFLQLSADERQWSVERMAERVRLKRPRRFWWLDFVSHPVVLGIELLIAIPAAHQAPDLFSAGLVMGIAMAPVLLIGGEG